LKNKQGNKQKKKHRAVLATALCFDYITENNKRQEKNLKKTILKSCLFLFEKRCVFMDYDLVKPPKHYCFSEIEPRVVIREWGLNFNLGSVIKYVARAGKKDDIIQDLEKAKQYLDFEIEALKNAKP
jgi:hypothetical protein